MDDEGDGEANVEGITWSEFALVLLALLLDMETSLDGLSSYRETNDKSHYHISSSFTVVFYNSVCFI